MNKETKRTCITAWEDMNEKCYNPEHPEYVNEGAKGITVADYWKAEKYGGLPNNAGLKNFLEWCENNPPPISGQEDKEFEDALPHLMDELFELKLKALEEDALRKIDDYEGTLLDAQVTDDNVIFYYLDKELIKRQLEYQVFPLLAA